MSNEDNLGKQSVYIHQYENFNAYFAYIILSLSLKKRLLRISFNETDTKLFGKIKTKVKYSAKYLK